MRHTPEVAADERDGAAVRFPPPLFYLFAVIAGGLLHELVVPLPLDLAPSVRIGGAAGAAVLGVAMLAGALGLFRRTGQDPKPWKSTPEVISSGVYKLSRNPMYVGMALLQTSIGVGWGNGWILVLVPAVLLIVYATVIRHEEAYLERKFGDAYVGYKRSVRRWL